MYRVNISIDDVSPHPLSSTKVLQQCFDLIKVFPKIKFTLFVPLAYWRTMPSPPSSMSQTAYQIDLHPEFCNELRALPKENFEIGYHGLFHGLPGQSNNDEFKDASYERAKFLFDRMNDIAISAGVRDLFKPIFRPPAWKMSPESFVASKEYGIEIYALSPKYDYEGEDEGCENVVYYNVNPPFDPLRLFPKTEIVYHACEWDRNYLSKKYAEELESLLKEQQGQIEFSFMENM
tara:strand:+ start:278 stop:979 length:702 start_codon:yes stop_codon:yes gene_type:complete